MSSDLIDSLLVNSSIYSIHYFHHMTMNLFIELQSPFARLAQLSCPQVYDQLLDPSSQPNPPKFSLKNIHIFLLCLLISIISMFICQCLVQFVPSMKSFRVLMMIFQHRLATLF